VAAGVRWPEPIPGPFSSTEYMEVRAAWRLTKNAARISERRPSLSLVSSRSRTVPCLVSNPHAKAAAVVAEVVIVDAEDQPAVVRS
jgi:hypothetical protein